MTKNEEEFIGVLHKFFSIPVGVLHVKDYPILDELFTNDIIHTNLEYQPNSWFCKVKTTFNKNAVNSIWAMKFLQVIDPYVKSFMENVFELDQNSGIKYLPEPWINLYEKGSFQELHSHYGSHETPSAFSFCYMHKLPNDVQCGNFIIESPIKNIEWHLSNNYKTQKRQIVECKEKDLIIFPSWLEHAATIHNCDEYRVTISGNLMVV